MDGSIGRINRILKKRIIPENEAIVPREQNGFRQICIMTEGCNLGKCGSCTMCNYGFTDRGRSEPADMSERILSGYDGTDILLGTSGSILDEKEFSNEDLMSVLAEIRRSGKVKNLILETSYRFVTEKRLTEISGALGDGIRVTIEMGLESSDPHVLKDCLNKSIDEDEYRKAVRTIHACGFGVSLNVLIGSPGLPYGAQIDDAESTVRWADGMLSECGGADRNDDRIIIFPVNVKPGNLLYELKENGFYRVGPHIQMLDLLSRFDGPLLDRIRLSWTYFDDGAMSDMYDFPGTCSHCREGIRKLYSEYTSCTSGRKALVEECMGMTEGCTCRNGPRSADSELDIGRISAEFIRPFRTQMSSYIDRGAEFSELDGLRSAQKGEEVPVIGIIGAPLIGKRTLANRYAARIGRDYSGIVRMDMGWDDGHRPNIPSGCLLLIENLDACIRVRRNGNGGYCDRGKEIRERLNGIIGASRPGLVLYTGMSDCGMGGCITLNGLDAGRAFAFLRNESSKILGLGMTEEDLGMSMDDLRLTEPYAINSLAHMIDSDGCLNSAEDISEYLRDWESHGSELNSQYAEETVKIAEGSLDHDCTELMDMLCINNDKRDFTESFIALCLNREFRPEADILRRMNLLRAVDRTDNIHLGTCYSLMPMEGFIWYGHIEHRCRWYEGVAYIYRGMAAVSFINNDDYKSSLSRENDRIVLNLLDLMMDCSVSAEKSKKLYEHIRGKTRLIRINPKIHECTLNHRITFPVPDYFITDAYRENSNGLSAADILALYDPRTYSILSRLEDFRNEMKENGEADGCEESYRALEYQLRGTWPMLIPDYMYGHYSANVCGSDTGCGDISKYILMDGYDPLMAIIQHLWFNDYFSSAMSYEVPSMHRAYNMCMSSLKLKDRMREVVDTLKNTVHDKNRSPDRELETVYDAMQNSILDICCTVNVLIDAIRLCITDDNSYLDRLIEDIFEWDESFSEWTVASDEVKPELCPAEYHILITFLDIRASIALIKAEKPGLFPSSETTDDNKVPLAVEPFMNILTDIERIFDLKIDPDDSTVHRDAAIDRSSFYTMHIGNENLHSGINLDVEEVTLSPDVFLKTASAMCMNCGTYYSIQTLPGMTLTAEKNRPVYFKDSKECFLAAYSILGESYADDVASETDISIVKRDRVQFCRLHESCLTAMVRQNEASSQDVHRTYRRTVDLARELNLPAVEENADCAMAAYLMNRGDYESADRFVQYVEKMMSGSYEPNTGVSNRINELRGDLCLLRDRNYAEALRYYEMVRYDRMAPWESSVIKSKMYRACVNIPDMPKAAKLKDELVIYLKTNWIGNYRISRRDIIDNMTREIII